MRYNLVRSSRKPCDIPTPDSDKYPLVRRASALTRAS